MYCPCSIMDLFEFYHHRYRIYFIQNIPTTLLKFPILFIFLSLQQPGCRLKKQNTHTLFNPRGFMWHFSPLVYKSGFGICFCTTYVASSFAFDKHSSGDAKHNTPQLVILKAISVNQTQTRPLAWSPWPAEKKTSSNSKMWEFPQFFRATHTSYTYTQPLGG